MQLLVGDLLRRNAEVVPDRAAASLGERSLSHRELEVWSNRLAHSIAGHGIGHVLGSVHATGELRNGTQQATTAELLEAARRSPLHTRSPDFRNLVEQTVRRVRGMDRVFKFEYDRDRGLSDEQAAHVAREVAAVRIVVENLA